MLADVIFVTINDVIHAFRRCFVIFAAQSKYLRELFSAMA